jgi:Sucrase/ferredoxin-like
VTSSVPAFPAPGPRCADVAEAAGDPMEGTAPPAQHWFLVEHPGPWAHYVLADPRLDRAAAVALDRWSRAQTGRVLLVRRPRRPVRASDPRRWFRVDSRPGHEAIRTGLFTHERELADVVADPAAGDRGDGPLYLVCTHGRHDTCCAVRGRPLAAALAADQPDRTWEASHVGACRFAAAMVLLPHGVVLGAVPAADGPDVAAGYAAGLLPARGIRGRAALPPAVQAAQHHARIATGAYGVDALVPVDVRDAGGSWHVTFVDPEVTVVLRERRVDTDRPLTCAATRPGWLRVFDLIEVALGTPVPS